MYIYIKKNVTTYTPHVHLNKEVYMIMCNDMFTYINNHLLIIFTNH